MTEDLPDPWVCAYVAGFIDGEGYLYIHGNNSKRAKHAHVTVTQVDRNPLDFLALHFGGRVGLPQHSNNPNARLHYRWSLQSPEAIKRLILAVEPYTIVKREHWAILRKLLFGGQWGKGIGLSDAEVLRRATLAEQIKSLNRRGIHA